MQMNLDPYALEAEQIRRRRAVADAMLEQSQRPFADRMAGGYVIPVHPLEGLAKLAQSVSAHKLQKRADEDVRALGTRRRTDIADAIDEYTRATGPRQISVPDVGRMTGSLDEQDAPRGQETLMPTAADRRTAAMTLAGRIGDPAGTARLLVAEAMRAPAAPKITTAAPGSRVLSTDPTTGQTTALMDVPDKPREGSSLAKLIAERDALPASDPRRALYDQAITKATTHQRPNVQSVTIKQEGEEAKTVGKGFGEQYIDLQRGAMAAATKLNNLSRMEQLMQGVSTGTLQPTIAQVAGLAQTLGFKIDEKLGIKQAIEALSNEMALQLRNPAGGAGMPGALSDKDREFLQNMTPGLAKTPQGNRLMIETARKLAQREVQVAQLARDYRVKHGQLNEGFYNELAAWSAANPLFRTADDVLRQYGGGR